MCQDVIYTEVAGIEHVLHHRHPDVAQIKLS